MFGFVAAAPGACARDLAEQVAGAIGRLDYSVTVVGSEAQHAPTEWFSNVEHGMTLHAKVPNYTTPAPLPARGKWTLVPQRGGGRLRRVK